METLVWMGFCVVVVVAGLAVFIRYRWRVVDRKYPGWRSMRDRSTRKR